MINAIMKPILEQLCKVMTDPIISKLNEKYEETFTKIDDLEAKGVSLDGVDKDKLEESKEAAKEQSIKSTQATLKKFGSAMTLLSDGTISLISRIAGSAAGIISTTPVGPGVSPNLLMPLLQQLKGEGDNLSKVFDDAKVAWDELELPESEATNTIKGTVESIFATAKGAIMAVGSNCDGESSPGLPTPDIPIEVPELDPNDCKNYSGSESEGEKTAAGCSAYEGMIEGKERSCNNCKKFKK